MNAAKIVFFFCACKHTSCQMSTVSTSWVDIKQFVSARGPGKKSFPGEAVDFSSHGRQKNSKTGQISENILVFILIYQNKSISLRRIFSLNTSKN